MRSILRRSVLRSVTASLRGGGGDHGGRMLPFARQAPPTTKMHPDSELVWDDGVAPEQALDIDAPMMSDGTMLKSMGCMILFILGLYSVIAAQAPAKNSPVVPPGFALPTREEMDAVPYTKKHQAHHH